MKKRKEYCCKDGRVYGGGRALHNSYSIWISRITNTTIRQKIFPTTNSLTTHASFSFDSFSLLLRKKFLQLHMRFSSVKLLLVLTFNYFLVQNIHQVCMKLLFYFCLIKPKNSFFKSSNQHFEIYPCMFSSVLMFSFSYVQ